MPLERIEITSQQTARLRMTQIICVSLVAGPLIIIAMALMALEPPQAADQTSLFLMINAVVSASAIAMSVFMPRAMAAARPQGAPVDLAQQYLTSTLVACALQEGAAIYSAINVLLTGDFVFLALLVPHLAFMALCVPTRSRLEMHLERMRQG